MSSSGLDCLEPQGGGNKPAQGNALGNRFLEKQSPEGASHQKLSRHAPLQKLLCLLAFTTLPTAASVASSPGPASTNQESRIINQKPASSLHLAQGLITGEVTASSALLQTRLTAFPAPSADGDVPGSSGTGCFEIATNSNFQDARRTPWLQASESGDFILRAKVEELSPATTYHWRAVFGTTRDNASAGPSASFQTLPAPDQSASVNFILTSCLNYAFFRNGPKGLTPQTDPDTLLGYPALEAVIRLKPNFVIFNGDCVYYDHPEATRAKTLPELRKKWHEQFVQPRFVRLFSATPTYWLKDDHDYRRNDSDPTNDYEPSHSLGIATFREQAPVLPSGDTGGVTYRTHRMGRDLQLWFVEGRDYRSPNRMPDGPEKSIWGATQKEWLKRTLKESDATFKILISPTPLIGPDDISKKDNHVNEAGFRQEGQEFLAWLRENGVAPGRFFILCGDRHWKYHSRHPSSFEEFSCGALNRENARLGRAPGDPKSTDPKATVRQLYTDPEPNGGFLRVSLEAASGARPPIFVLSQHDDQGNILYRYQATP